MKTSAVVVTGIGVVSPIGQDLDSFWAANIGAFSGIGPIKAFDTFDLKMQVAGEVLNFDPGQYMNPNIVRRTDRFAQLGIAATEQAIKDSKILITDDNSHRIGVIFGSGLGGSLFHEQMIYKMIYGGGPKMIMPSSVQKITPNSVSSWIAITHKITGPNYVVSTACSSGSNAIGLGKILIDAGLIDVCVTGGVEAPITKANAAAYENMGVLDCSNSKSQNVPRPFDRERKGMVLAEGAACLILESYEHASKRNAKIRGTVLGYGSNCGAYNMTAPDPSGKDAANAMTMAIKNSDLNPSDIGYINAHGTGTQQNDKVETIAIKKVFGDRAYNLPISSTKSLMGHAIGAAGAIEAIVCLMALHHNEIPPTANLINKDPECDLDYVPLTSRKCKIDNAISNSFGFGSNNAVLVFGSAN